MVRKPRMRNGFGAGPKSNGHFTRVPFRLPLFLHGVLGKLNCQLSAVEQRADLQCRVLRPWLQSSMPVVPLDAHSNGPGFVEARKQPDHPACVDRLGTVWSGSTMFTRCYTARGLVNVQSSYGSFNLPNFVQHQQTTCLMSELSCSSDPNSKDLHFSEEVYLNLASLTLCSSWWCGEKRVPPTSRQIIRNMCPELTLA